MKDMLLKLNIELTNGSLNICSELNGDGVAYNVYPFEKGTYYYPDILKHNESSTNLLRQLKKDKKAISKIIDRLSNKELEGEE